MGIAKKNRRNLLALARKHEAEALAGAKLAAQPEREAVRRDVPFTSWNGFLQLKAEQGNETALAVLRSRKESVGEDMNPAPEKDWSRPDREQFQGGRVEQATRERVLLEKDGLTGRAKTRLLAVLRMEAVAAEDAAFAGFRHRVDRRGAVIFTLRGGGVIRDQGRELFFSVQDATARQAAMAYARKKWGRGVMVEENRIIREPERQLAAAFPEQEKDRGFSR